MKKIILIFAVLGIFFLLAKQPASAFFEEEDDFSIFADPNFTQPTNNFSPGQMVYVKVESFVNGDREKTLRILDSDKRETQRFNLNHSGNIFTVSFAAPNTSGIYYVDIKIRDFQGSVYSSQENIIVGQVSGQSVSSEAVAIAEGGEGQVEAVAESIVEEKAQPTPELEVGEKALPEIQKNFLSQFLEKLFAFLRKFFGLGFGT